MRIWKSNLGPWALNIETARKSMIVRRFDGRVMIRHTR